MAGGINPFVYALNNPTNLIDPYGLWVGFDDIFTGPIDEIVVIGGLGILAALGSKWAVDQLDNIKDFFDKTEDDDKCPRYHRLESPTQTSELAQLQVAGGEIWGRAPRGSDIPAVQAYIGPLPKGAKGIEFATPIVPDKGNPPGRVSWRGPRSGVRIENDYAKIKVFIIKNTQ